MIDSRTQSSPDDADVVNALKGTALDNVWSVGVPTTPPRISREEAARGLALLDLSLRMNHVARVTERLSFRQRAFAERHIAMDVDLSRLTTEQLRALRVPSRSSSSEAIDRIWLPIARQPARDLNPTLVHDGSGDVLPLLTSHEAGKALSAALIRLFRMLLDAHPDAQTTSTPVGALRHKQNRARWLVELAIAHAVDEAGSAHHDRVDLASGGALRRSLPRGDPGGGQPTVAYGTDSYSIRMAAAEGARALLGNADSPFFRLLKFVLTENLLIVQAPVVSGALFLHYELPRLSPTLPSNHLARWLRGFSPVSGMLIGAFTTVVPRDVSSYHLELEVDDEVHVSQFVMSTNVDDGLVAGIAQDAAAVAASFRDLQERPDSEDAGSRYRKLLETELQSVASRVAELASRRSADLIRYSTYRDSLLNTYGLESARTLPPVLGRDEALARLGGGRFSLDDLLSFAGHYHADAYRRLAFDALGPLELHNMAKRLHDLNLGADVVCDNDPREHGAHVHWKPRFVDSGRGAAEPIRAKASFVLTDESPSLAGSVVRFIGCLVALVALIGTAAVGNLTWLVSGWDGGASIRFGDSDAVVAALLLVPGLLVTRLQLPTTNSVVYSLRSYQTRLAYAAIAVTAALAFVVAGTDSAHRLTSSFVITFAVLGVLLALSAWELLLRRQRRRRPPVLATMPAWLHDGGRISADAPVHVQFDGVGGG